MSNADIRQIITNAMEESSAKQLSGPVSITVTGRCQR